MKECSNEVLRHDDNVSKNVLISLLLNRSRDAEMDQRMLNLHPISLLDLIT